MKNALGLFFLLMSPGTISAQTDEIVLRNTNLIQKQQTPRAVIDSFEKRYANANDVRYYETSLAAAKKAWIMVSSRSKSWPSENTTYYTVSFRIKDFHRYSLFEKNGKLVKHKAEQKKSTAPGPVKHAVASVSRVLPGYAINGKTCFKVFHVDSGNEYYEMIATNGSDTRHLYYTPNGYLVKVKE
jgi:hypothetical protein